MCPKVQVQVQVQNQVQVQVQIFFFTKILQCQLVGLELIILQQIFFYLFFQIVWTLGLKFFFGITQVGCDL
jgi:hypothetical protein